jgi:hypothetical protein
VPGWNVVVFRRSGAWAYRLNERTFSEDPASHVSPQVYQTSDEAKLAAFDALDELKDRPVTDWTD